MNVPTQVWSCGGGTQSGAIATLIRLGKLPRPDFAFMTDTGRERRSTWPFVDGFIRPALSQVGLELRIIKSEENGASLDVVYISESGEQTVLLPGWTTMGPLGPGKLSPFCSGKWKRDVAERYMRSIGIERARNWIGISRDEARRIRAQHRPWLELWYPLIFKVPMTRDMCVSLIREQGWVGQIPHSACYMCPNHSDAEWIDMKINWPEDFLAACELEAETRLKDRNFYLHPSCVPLAEVDFFSQTTMFAERGCYQGCFT